MSDWTSYIGRLGPNHGSNMDEGNARDGRFETPMVLLPLTKGQQMHGRQRKPWGQRSRGMKILYKIQTKSPLLSHSPPFSSNSNIPSFATHLNTENHSYIITMPYQNYSSYQSDSRQSHGGHGGSGYGHPGAPSLFDLMPRSRQDPETASRQLPRPGPSSIPYYCPPGYTRSTPQSGGFATGVSGPPPSQAEFAAESRSNIIRTLLNSRNRLFKRKPGI